MNSGLSSFASFLLVNAKGSKRLGGKSCVEEIKNHRIDPEPNQGNESILSDDHLINDQRGLLVLGLTCRNWAKEPRKFSRFTCGGAKKIMSVSERLCVVFNCTEPVQAIGAT